ncbi:hypothetical protein [Algoriphagus resistens]|uniref:hypothetical protein n=1 Tax=Algoriphagus resistens TaxID=1750590 RepID=UPI000AF4935A|nr:hypothetical protein [Algoriphagus resistens]
MKKTVLVFAIMLSASVAFSQSTLKGPKAKNATPAERVAHASALQFYSEPAEAKGPAAKNKKVWQGEDVTTKTVFVRKEQPLKGPKAKNKKVWKD